MELYHMLTIARQLTNSTNAWFDTPNPAADPWPHVKVACATTECIALEGRALTAEEVQMVVKDQMSADLEACEQASR